MEDINKVREQRRVTAEKKERGKDRERYETIATAPHDARPVRVTCLVHSQAAEHIDHVPSFDQYKNDMWDTRARLLQRFSSAASTVIVRQRIDRRLAAIKDRLAEAGITNRTQARVFVERESRQAMGGAATVSTGGGSDVGQASLSLALARIQPDAFPVYNEVEASMVRKPLATKTPRSFEYLKPCALKIPSECESPLPLV